MKQLKHILIIVFPIILLGSCSFLEKVSGLENKSSNKWIESDICDSHYSLGGYMVYDYKYKKNSNDSLSILVCPCLYSCWRSFGPPLVPFISSSWIPIKREEDLFYVDLLFQDFKDKIIDVNTLEYSINKSKIKIIPNRIELLGYHNRNGELVAQKLYVSSDSLKLRVHFDLPVSKIKQLTINFDNFTVNDSIMPFPILDLKRKSVFLYDPIQMIPIGH